jgi:hypothetical protein
MTTYLVYDMMKLRDTIPVECLFWTYVPMNPSPGAISLSRDHLDKVDWNSVCTSGKDEYLLTLFPEKIVWTRASRNKHFFSFLKRHLDNVHIQLFSSQEPKNVVEEETIATMIATYLQSAEKKPVEQREEMISAVSWNTLSSNSFAVPILSTYLSHVSWKWIAWNKPNTKGVKPDTKDSTSDVTELIEKYGIDKIDWYDVSRYGRFTELYRKHPHQVSWSMICETCKDMDFLEEHLSYIDWVTICKNKDVVPFLEKHLDKIKIDHLSHNPNPQAIQLMMKHVYWVNELHTLNWYNLSRQPDAIPLLERNLDRVRWDQSHASPKMLPFLRKHPEHIEWYILSCFPHSMKFVEESVKKNLGILPHLNWRHLSSRPEAISILEQHPEYIEWGTLAKNEAAIHLIEEHIATMTEEGKKTIENREFLMTLALNPAIYTYNYEAIQGRMNVIKEELFEAVFHPSNFDKFAAWGHM